MAFSVVTLLAIALFLAWRYGGRSSLDDAGPEIAAKRQNQTTTPAIASNEGHSWRQDRGSDGLINNVYDANAPLARQLHKLRALSDNHDPYATCVLAWALDLCARGRDRVSISQYYSADMKSLDEESITHIALYFEFQERYGRLCSGLVEADLWDIDQRLLQSARMGHARSMRLLAQFPDRGGSGLGVSSPSFLHAQRQHAEEMLNRAAEAGDAEAIREVQHSYARGYIISGLGDIQVEIDLAKSMAALRAISLRETRETREEAERMISDAVNRMSARERVRFERLAAAYNRAYRDSQHADDQLQRALNDFPEQACANGSPTSGQIHRNGRRMHAG